MSLENCFKSESFSKVKGVIRNNITYLLAPILIVTLSCEDNNKIFDPPVLSPPDTEFIAKPPSNFLEGLDAEIVWRGYDLDGVIVAYDYKLDHRNWIRTRNTSYNVKDLHPGPHKFQVKSIDDDGLEDPSPANYEFNIAIID